MGQYLLVDCHETVLLSYAKVEVENGSVTLSPFTPGQPYGYKQQQVTECVHLHWPTVNPLKPAADSANCRHHFIDVFEMMAQVGGSPGY